MPRLAVYRLTTYSISAIVSYEPNYQSKQQFFQAMRKSRHGIWPYISLSCQKWALLLSVVEASCNPRISSSLRGNCAACAPKKISKERVSANFFCRLRKKSLSATLISVYSGAMHVYLQLVFMRSKVGPWIPTSLSFPRPALTRRCTSESGKSILCRFAFSSRKRELFIYVKL